MYGHCAYNPAISCNHPSRLALCATVRVRLPPPDSPETIRWLTPSSARCAATHRTPDAQSFNPAGNVCGPSFPPELRNSTPTTTRPVPARYSRIREYITSAALAMAMPPPCRCTTAGSGPSTSGRLMYSVTSLPSSPVIVVVVVVTPSASGAPDAKASSTAPTPASHISAYASRSASGASMVSGTTGMLASSPNCANAATIRGSDRGSVPIEQSGSARRPSAMWRRYIDVEHTALMSEQLSPDALVRQAAQCLVARGRVRC